RWRFPIATRPRSSAGTQGGCLRSISIVALFCAAAVQAASPVLKKETIESGGRKHLCMIYVPARLSSASPAPLLLLFHGSGRDGMSQINEWRKLAETEGIIL